LKCFSLPKRTEGLIFDIDQTLYRHDHYYNLQEDLQVREFAKCEAIGYEQAAEKIRHYRESEGRKNEGQKPSLGNTFRHFGYPLELTVQWREKLFFPEKYLHYDNQLVQAFSRLRNQCKIIAVTNNADNIGWKTLEVLGIKSFFINVIGLNSSMVSKPHKAPFENAQVKLELPANAITSIGDRFHIDLELPLEMGMGGILVESMEDVYDIPKILKL
jgi:FMN phosphatase YigB (HAD superfamily)